MKRLTYRLDKPNRQVLAYDTTDGYNTYIRVNLVGNAWIGFTAKVRQNVPQYDNFVMAFTTDFDPSGASIATMDEATFPHLWSMIPALAKIVAQSDEKVRSSLRVAAPVSPSQRGSSAPNQPASNSSLQAVLAALRALGDPSPGDPDYKPHSTLPPTTAVTVPPGHPYEISQAVRPEPAINEALTRVPMFTDETRSTTSPGASRQAAVQSTVPVQQQARPESPLPILQPTIWGLPVSSLATRHQEIAELEICVGFSMGKYVDAPATDHSLQDTVLTY